MSEELRPCPFCGEMPEVEPNGDCYCDNYICPMAPDSYMPKDWNTRPIEDALRKRIAELEAGLISAGKQQGLYLQELMDLRAAQRWIPVSKPPKVSGKYLLLNIYDDVYPCDFIAGTEIWVLPDYDSITHWMPLPEPPEVK